MSNRGYSNFYNEYDQNGRPDIKGIETEINICREQLEDDRYFVEECLSRGQRPKPAILNRIEHNTKQLGKLEGLLKKEIKREKEGKITDETIIDAFGISAKEAMETKTPETAAMDKQPKPQNFKSARLEKKQEKPVNEDEVVENEIIIKKINDPQPTLEDYQEPLDNVIEEESFYVEDDLIPISPIPEDNPEYYSTAFNNQEKETEQQISVSDNTRDLKPADNKVVSCERASVKETKASMAEKGIQETVSTEFETLNNDSSQKEIVDNEKSDETKEFIQIEPENNTKIHIVDGQVVLNKNSFEEPTEYWIPGVDEKVQQNDIKIPIFSGITTNSIVTDFEIYKPYPPLTREVYASFDLSEYTNMINTDSVVGEFDNKKKILSIRFYDPRDYSIFYKLLKEKKPRIFNFLEKPKSIFMDIYTKYNEEELIFHYEFTGCRLRDLIDSGYVRKEDDRFDKFSHRCELLFKYKKLKLK